MTIVVLLLICVLSLAFTAAVIYAVRLLVLPKPSDLHQANVGERGTTNQEETNKSLSC